jgi:hypothetical protein
MHFAKNACSKAVAVFIVWVLAPSCLNQQSLSFSPKRHFPVATTSCVPKFYYQSVYCCLIRYFLVRIRTAKCFTNSSSRFRCEVTFENEHTFCSWIHHIRTCIAFAQLAWAAAQQQRSSWPKCHQGGWESRCTCFWKHFCTVARDCCSVVF